MKPRRTPEEEYDRLAEQINTQFGDNIKDEESFNTALESYMEGTPKGVGILAEEPRNKLFDIYARKAGITKRNLFKEAGGKDLAKDRQQTAKMVVRDVDKYVKYGAQKSDLKGYDTKMRLYNKSGFVRGRPVYVVRTSVKVKGRTVVRHRDPRGRFAKLKERERK